MLKAVTATLAPTDLGGKIIGNLLVVLLIAGWWLMSQHLSNLVLPGPRAVGEAIFELFTVPDKAWHVLASVVRVLIAVGLSVVIGTMLALLAYGVPLFQAIVHERINPLLNSFPSVGWAVLAVIWLGVSNTTVVFIEVMILIPFSLINIAEGLRQLDSEMIEMGRSFTRKPVRSFFRITLPLTLPYLLAALRMSYGVGWKLCLVAELFGVHSGLGFVMLRAETVGDAANVFATCFAVVLLSIAGERLLIDPLTRYLQLGERRAS
jgi:NitT/TauT family transport system permease protein/sulfonate transport system permease protein